MVAPITGPFSRNVQLPFTAGANIGSLVAENVSTWYRQKRPFTLPLDLTARRGSCSVTESGNYADGKRPWNLTWVGSKPSSISSDAYNRAWGKYNSSIRSGAQWGVSMLQYRQSFDMMTNRVTQLAGVLRDIRRGNIHSLLSRFGPPPGGLKRKGKSLGDNILEWRFGWQPLWNDIHATAEYLGDPLPAVRDRDGNKTNIFVVRGRGSSEWTVNTYHDYSTSSNPEAWRRVATKYSQKVTLQSSYRITNPNALLWDSLGLTNPAMWVYESIPFSFVLNYFFSIEEYVLGLTPWMGIDLYDSFTSTLSKADASGTMFARANIPGYVGGSSFTGWRVWQDRKVGAISGPSLRLRDPWILQPGRGLNAVALLLQQLGKTR